ncbi:N-acetyltransferase [Undibacterium sp. Jales W-56]|uniref:acyltransferase n=1 Tax=Undibacterium sp. Jales W-56 TaxID=2897325 RepID=UPI0021D28F84|nr:N-acetyltransferase [Undibacterium sp. Jales W-56]MCU6434597.1 N-acetyltransferase [Undibacterium sp. Jales W-56]
MIHPTAIVSPAAKIGKSIKIGAFSIIHDKVEIGDESEIGSHCEIGIATPLSDGSPLIIGAHSTIRSHSIFYAGSIFGDRLVTGHRVTVREGTHAGLNLQIGTLSDIQGDCTIGDYVRLHSNVHIGKKSVVGNFVWIFPYVVLTNDPTPPSSTLLGCEIGDYTAVATMSVVLPGVKIGQHCLIGAHACVGKNVADGMIAAGIPAKTLGPTSNIQLRDGSGLSAYPWTTHFHRGYPEEIIKQWKKENDDNPLS